MKEKELIDMLQNILTKYNNLNNLPKNQLYKKDWVKKWITFDDNGVIFNIEDYTHQDWSYYETCNNSYCKCNQ